MSNKIDNLSFNYLSYLTRLTWFPESCSGPVQPCLRAWARVAVIWPAQPYQIAEHLGRPAVEGLGLLWDLSPGRVRAIRSVANKLLPNLAYLSTNGTRTLSTEEIKYLPL